MHSVKRHNNQRWTSQRPRVPSTRRGLEPKRPAFVPARRKQEAQEAKER